MGLKKEALRLKTALLLSTLLRRSSTVKTRPVATGGIREKFPQILLCPEKLVLNI